jgi:5-formyltetrahydrofolate cyclo-ligase
MNTPELPHTSAAWAEAWADWIAFRKEIKKPLTPTSVKKQAKFLHAMSEADAIACLEQSIRNGWQGLFPVSKTFKATVHIHHEEGGGF